MPTWIPPDVEAEPSVLLEGWAVFKVVMPKVGRPTAHLAGYNIGGYEGRVSSQLVKFDLTARCGLTSSGRLYRLLGRPGLGIEAEYVWNRWVANWDVTSFEEISVQALQEFLAESSSAGA